MKLKKPRKNEPKVWGKKVDLHFSEEERPSQAASRRIKK